MKQSSDYQMPPSHIMQQMSRKFRKTQGWDLKWNPMFHALAWDLLLSSQLQDSSYTR